MEDELAYSQIIKILNTYKSITLMWQQLKICTL